MPTVSFGAEDGHTPTPLTMPRMKEQIVRLSKRLDELARVGITASTHVRDLNRKLRILHQAVRNRYLRKYDDRARRIQRRSQGKRGR